ncbi:WD40/YVTN/BNR-like repeat-containing protein [Natronocella acetinitrilica]|nr:hypothetical protein [Natronocella acetinitrilica]
MRKAALLPLVSALLLLACGGSDETLSVTELSEKTHVHGLAVAADDPERLYIASHFGLYVADPGGTARLVSEERHDFMGFTPHPLEPQTLFASGHPHGGGNLGFLVSEDRGVTWTRRASGVRGPVDFHQMDVSPADANVIYGVYQGLLQHSADGGHTWELRGQAPQGLIELAASSRRPERLFAATQNGLLVSHDGGGNWERAHSSTAPSSTVRTVAAGHVYAYIVGVGLVQASEGSLNWRVVGEHWGDDFMLHLAVDPSDPNRMFTVNSQGRVLSSSDGGASWAPF